MYSIDASLVSKILARNKRENRLDIFCHHKKWESNFVLSLVDDSFIVYCVDINDCVSISILSSLSFIIYLMPFDKFIGGNLKILSFDGHFNKFSYQSYIIYIKFYFSF